MIEGGIPDSQPMCRLDHRDYDSFDEFVDGGGMLRGKITDVSGTYSLGVFVTAGPTARGTLDHEGIGKVTVSAFFVRGTDLEGGRHDAAVELVVGSPLQPEHDETVTTRVESYFPSLESRWIRITVLWT
jgi:hypothetical protein